MLRLRLETERLYGKDALCPVEWEHWLRSGVLPERTLPSGKGDLFRYFSEEVRDASAFWFLN